MILNSTPVLANSVKAFARSLLFSLGVDHVLIDFLTNIAIGEATVLLALLYVGIASQRSNRATRPNPR
jgi:hypothetical protein